MRALTIIENTACGDITAEHGLSIYIENNGKKFLLDMGASDAFLENAKKLSVDISDIDIAVLSHAHYDHSGGMTAFFEANKKAKLYISINAKENCAKIQDGEETYIGIESGVLEKYADRFVFADGFYKIDEGVYLVPHFSKGLEKIGLRESLYIKTASGLVPDDFAHEQSLVFDLNEGLVIFNSCSHGGADVIINEVRSVLPGREIFAYVGGLHLKHAKEAFVLEYADKLLESGAKKVFTGHCTGDEAYAILHLKLKGALHALSSGKRIDL